MTISILTIFDLIYLQSSLLVFLFGKVGIYGFSYSSNQYGSMVLAVMG